MKIFAHRGGKNAVAHDLFFAANTLINFDAAISLGATGIEADICLTKDRQPIIYHPKTLEPSPQRMNWPAVRELYSFIPSLAELFRFMSGRQAQCLLDLKQQSEELVRLVVTGINKYNLHDKVFITAPEMRIPMTGLYANTKLLKYAKSLDKGVKTHLISTTPIDIVAIAKDCDINMVSFGWLPDSSLSKILYRCLINSMVRDIPQINKLGIEVLAGIANTKEEIMSLVSKVALHGGNLDGIVTDETKLALGLLPKLTNMTTR